MARYSSRKKHDRPLTILKHRDSKTSGVLLTIIVFGIVLALGGILLALSSWERTDDVAKDHRIEQKTAPPATTGRGG